MSGPELCAECMGLHYRRSPCIVRKPIDVTGIRAIADRSKGDVPKHKQPWPEPTDPTIPLEKRRRGRPKTITDMKAYKAKWARDYRARKASKSNPNTPERNDK